MLESLSKCISEQTCQSVSASTLKRLWGYLDEGVTPRRSAVDVLSLFLGYRDWDDFCEQTGKAAPTDDGVISKEAIQEEHTPEFLPPHRHR